MTNREYIRKPSVYINSIKRRVFDLDEITAALEAKIITQTALEQKTFGAMLQIAYEQKEVNPERTIFKIYFTDVKEMFPSLATRTNAEFINAVHMIFNLSFKITSPFAKMINKDEKLGNFMYTEFRVISSLTMFDNGVEFSLSEPAMMNLVYNKFFTKLNLNEMEVIGNSNYALSLYELFKSYERAFCTPVFTIDEIKGIMGVDENAAYDFRRLNDKVLKKYIDDINTKTSITIEMITKRSGRTVTGVYFKISKKETQNEDTVNEELFVGLRDEVIEEIKYATINGKKRMRDHLLVVDLIEKYKNNDVNTISNIHVKLLNKACVTDKDIEKAILKVHDVYANEEESVESAIDGKDGYVTITLKNQKKGKKRIIEKTYSDFVFEMSNSGFTSIMAIMNGSTLNAADVLENMKCDIDVPF